MATYAIGDIQGCGATLDALLRHVGFDPARDRLWCAGDVVNRGPDSLGVVRRLMGLGSRVTVTLGNHDLHLLGRVAGARAAKRGDTLDALLAAPDRGAIVDWLRRQPVMHVEGGWVMFHAGLLPEWKLATARRWAEQVEGALGAADWAGFLVEAEGALPGSWAGADRGERLRLTLAALTRLRMVDAAGWPAWDYKGPPAGAPVGLSPWYAGRPHGAGAPRLLFGHWAAHGFARLDVGYALDSGCVWGQALTALRLDDEAVFAVPTAAVDRRPVSG